MTAFESELGRRLRDETEGVVVSPRLTRRTLVRARRRRRANLIVAGIVAAAAIAAVTWAWPSPGSVYDRLPPAKVVPQARPARALGEGPCRYGRAVRARAAALPAGARCAWTAEGDFDGDGRADAAYSYGIAAGTTKSDPKWLRSRWYVRIDLGTGRGLSERFSSKMKLGMPSTPRLAGSSDADDDGKSELFLATDTGNGATVTIYALDGARLANVFEPPRPFAFNVVGGANYLSGLSCEEADGGPGLDLVVRSAQGSEGDAGQTYDTSTTVYRWTGDASLEQIDLARTTAPLSEDEMDAYSKLDCAGLEWRP